MPFNLETVFNIQLLENFPSFGNIKSCIGRYLDRPCMMLLQYNLTRDALEHI